MYLIDDEQESEEITECEINDTQAIRFLKATKLEFNFLEKVSESERKTVMNLISYRKESKWTWNGSLQKERKRLGEFLQIYDQKDQEIVECEIEYSQVIRFMKTSKLEKINFLEKVNETERKW